MTTEHTRPFMPRTFMGRRSIVICKRILPAAVACALLGTTPSALAAQQPSNAQLMRLLKQQAAQLDALRQRLATLEAHEKNTAAGTAAVSAGQSAATQAQVQAVVAASRASVELVKAQTAGMHGGGGAGASWGTHGRGGPEFSSDDGFFTFRPTGRALIDFTATQHSRYEARNINGSSTRQARLGAIGSIGALGYHVEADFANDDLALRQAYLTYTWSLAGHRSRVYVGNFLKDLGIEGSSESARLPFMLRNAAAAVGEPLNSYFGLGSQFKIWGNNWHYSLSVSGDSPGASSNGDSSDSVAYLTRAHWNPIKTGSGFLHLGAWYYYQKISSGVSSINSHPPIALDYNGNLDVSASSIDNPTQDHGKGFELGGVYRNMWAIAEYARRSIDSSTDPSVDRHGSSLSAGWMITGEKPGFSSHSGNWQAVHVIHPLTSGGPGAFELAARVDHYDFRGAPRGGDGQSYTLGLNWYLNDWSRLMFDYIRWHTDNKVGSEKGSDWGNSYGVRTQITF